MSGTPTRFKYHLTEFGYVRIMDVFENEAIMPHTERSTTMYGSTPSAEVTLSPLHVPTATIVTGIEQALATQRARRVEVEELRTEGFDALVAALSDLQKERVIAFIRATYGTDPEEISKENERQAKLRAAQRKTAAQIEDAPLLEQLAFYTAITDKEVEVAPGSPVLDWLPKYEDTSSTDESA